MFDSKTIQQKQDDIFLIDGRGDTLTYGGFMEYCRTFCRSYGLRERDFVVLLCENTVGAARFLLACLYNRIVPLLLNGGADGENLERYISAYRPDYIFDPQTNDLKPLKNDGKAGLYGELSLLLPTSGTTGSPKLVRHSYKNIYANAKNVAEAFGLNGSERAMLSLPVYFTQGLSVLCSHFYAGASVYLSGEALSSRAFWDSMKNGGITSFTGVPYSYEILDKLRFYTMKLPDLSVISQGGGRLSDTLWDKLVSYAAETDKKFIATYGASETTARMSLLQPEYASARRCSIGKPIGVYEMWLADENGDAIDAPNVRGELVFKGESVTLGYAENRADLEKGDERYGVYKTGDIAYRDEDGFYYITGRLSRFLKIFGLRIGLDETERLLKSRFNYNLACAGNDDNLYVFTSDKGLDGNEIILYLKDKLQINISAFKVVYIDEIPKNQYGKVSYAVLDQMVQEAVKNEQSG